jgi:hypothetical protein
VDAGSRQENASKQESRAPVLIQSEPEKLALALKRGERSPRHQGAGFFVGDGITAAPRKPLVKNLRLKLFPTNDRPRRVTAGDYGASPRETDSRFVAL